MRANAASASPSLLLHGEAFAVDLIQGGGNVAGLRQVVTQRALDTDGHVLQPTGGVEYGPIA